MAPLSRHRRLLGLAGKYVLFFSSHCHATPKYDVAYATSDNVRVLYKKYRPLFVAGVWDMTAPSGLDIDKNGDKAFGQGHVQGSFHAEREPCTCFPVRLRHVLRVLLNIALLKRSIYL